MLPVVSTGASSGARSASAGASASAARGGRRPLEVLQRHGLAARRLGLHRVRRARDGDRGPGLVLLARRLGGALAEQTADHRHLAGRRVPDGPLGLALVLDDAGEDLGAGVGRVHRAAGDEGRGRLDEERQRGPRVWPGAGAAAFVAVATARIAPVRGPEATRRSSAIFCSQASSASRPARTARRPSTRTEPSRTVGTTPATQVTSGLRPTAAQPTTVATTRNPARSARRRAAAPRRATEAARAARACAARRAASAVILSWVPCGRSTVVPPVALPVATGSPLPGVSSPAVLLTVGPETASWRLRRSLTATTRSASENRSSVRDSSSCCRCRSLCGTRYATHRPTSASATGPARSFTSRR